METLVGAGHTISFDWTVDIESENQEEKSTKALKERDAICDCGVLVYLWKDNQESARFEVGMAMGLGKKIVVVTDHKAWFFALPEVIQIDSDDLIVSTIGKLEV